MDPSLRSSHPDLGGIDGCSRGLFRRLESAPVLPASHGLLSLSGAIFRWARILPSLDHDHRRTGWRQAVLQEDRETG